MNFKVLMIHYNNNTNLQIKKFLNQKNQKNQKNRKNKKKLNLMIIKPVLMSIP